MGVSREGTCIAHCLSAHHLCSPIAASRSPPFLGGACSPADAALRCRPCDLSPCDRPARDTAGPAGIAVHRLGLGAGTSRRVTQWPGWVCFLFRASACRRSCHWFPHPALGRGSASFEGRKQPGRVRKERLKGIVVQWPLTVVSWSTKLHSSSLLHWLPSLFSVSFPSSFSLSLRASAS
jgi:hypothetical protein